jgi:hypothetical protein
MLSVILCNNPHGTDEAGPIENTATGTAMIFP